MPQRHVGRPLLHNIALDPCLLPNGGPPLCQKTGRHCASPFEPCFVIPNATPFIWIRILFIFTGGELDPTWSVPTPFIIHNLTRTQTTSRLPTSNSGSTDARMVWYLLLDWIIDISRLNVSRYCFSQLVVSRINFCWTNGLFNTTPGLSAVRYTNI